MRVAILLSMLFAVVACGRAAEAPKVEQTRAAAPVFTQPPLRTLASAPATPDVCLEDAEASFERRLAVDAAWNDDPLAGGMSSRLIRYRIPTHSFASLRDGLARYPRPTVALVTYAGESESCAWLISASGVEAYGRSGRGRAGIREDVAAVIEALDVRGAMAARSAVEASQPAQASPDLSALREGPLATALANVAETLMPGPIVEALPRFEAMVIVPHENLAAFPFALMPARRAEGPTVYLGDRMVMEVTPALGEIGIGPGLHRNLNRNLAAMTLEQRRTMLAHALVVGDPAFGGVLPQLPGAAAEARAVAATFGAEPLIGEAATLSAVRQRMSQDRPIYVHFASHGLADRDQVAGNASFLALAEGRRLQARDVRNLGVGDGGIVVLSACQSGLGAARPGGIIGLPRSFQIGGAQTVVMSLWNVDDAATGLMMQVFARELLATGRPAYALAVAQRETRTQFPDPRKWASFVVFSSGPL